MRHFLSRTSSSCYTALRGSSRHWRSPLITTRCYSCLGTTSCTAPKKSRSILDDKFIPTTRISSSVGQRIWDSSFTTTLRRQNHVGSSGNNKGLHDHNHNHSAELARMMIPSDANVAGNVHGGTIMQMMEEAAGVAAARYFNQPPIGSTTNTATSQQQKLQKKQQAQQRVCALTSRVEQMTFQAPIHVGDVAKVRAQVVFASMHTVAVAVEVKAERMAWFIPNNTAPPSSNNLEETVCNRALVWLVGVVLPNQRISVHQLNPKLYARALAPPFPTPDEKTNPLGFYAYELAAQAYKARQLRHQSIPGSSFDEDASFASSRKKNFGTSPSSTKTTTCFTPDYSAVELAQVMLPSDCISDTGLVSGGVVMKLMDNACGVAAVRHCGTNVVTVSVDSVDLVAPVVLGDVLRVRARPTYTSSKSMELQVSVVAERFTTDSSTAQLTRQEVVTTQHAYFTFVSLPLIARNSSREEDSSSPASAQKGTPPSSLPMRPLVLETEHDKAQFELGKKRYEHRQATRRQSN